MEGNLAAVEKYDENEISTTEETTQPSSNGEVAQSEIDHRTNGTVVTEKLSNPDPMTINGATTTIKSDGDIEMKVLDKGSNTNNIGNGESLETNMELSGNSESVLGQDSLKDSKSVHTQEEPVGGDFRGELKRAEVPTDVRQENVEPITKHPRTVESSDEEDSKTLNDEMEYNRSNVDEIRPDGVLREGVVDAGGSVDMEVDEDEDINHDTFEDVFKFQWKLRNYSEIVERLRGSDDEQRKVNSPSFRHPNGDLWRLLVFPLGNKVSGSKTSQDLSVFLEVGEEPTLEAEEEEKNIVGSPSQEQSASGENVDDSTDSSTSTSVAPSTAAVDGDNTDASATRVDGEVTSNGVKGGSGANAVTTPATYLDKPIAPRRYKSVSFTITLVNHVDSAKTKVNTVAHHEFTPESKDWGFKEFMTVSQLLDPSNGFLTPEGDLVFEVTVTPTLEYRSQYYDSKEETGMVGLRNLGATCYLNSLLQTLYHTREFRFAVYSLDTSNDAENDGVALELQRLFWNMQTSDDSVGTRQLTRAFGWTNFQCFTQHDVQELNRELCDKLEERMKGTSLQGTVGRLFKGRYKSFIKCINVQYESSRVEDYYDIQLDIKGMKNVEESFAKYVETERLDGDNQYEASQYGKQDADKGVGFLSFPPVLHLHLKRFEYNMYADNTVKINDRYEFPTELNLNKYLYHEEGAAPAEQGDFDYVLHSVLVHSGDIHCGHYYAFIHVDGAWYKFDDETVTRVPKVAAVENTFGGEFHTQGGEQRERRPLYMRWANAYMLVYVRKSMLPQVMLPIPDELVPRSLVARFRAEHEGRMQREQEIKESHLYQVVQVGTSRDLDEFIGYRYRGKRRSMDFVGFNKELRVRKTSSCAQVYEEVARALDLNPQRIRLWVCSSRENDTIRPDLVIDRDDGEGRSLLSFTDELLGHVLYLWVEEAVGDASLGLENGDNTPALASLSKPVQFPSLTDRCLIFLRYFDAQEPVMNHKLKHVCHMFLSPQEKLENILPDFCKAVDLGEDPVEVLELLALNRIEPVRTDCELRKLELSTGDIIVLQRKVVRELVQDGDSTESDELASNEEPLTNDWVRVSHKDAAEDTDNKDSKLSNRPQGESAEAKQRPMIVATKFTDVISWMSHIQNRVRVQLIPLSDLDSSGVVLDLRKDMTADQVFPEIASHLPGTPDPEFIRLTQQDSAVELPKAAPANFSMVPTNGVQHQEVLRSLLSHHAVYDYDVDPPFKLYYEVLKWPLSLLATHRLLQVDVLCVPDNRQPQNEQGLAKCQRLFGHHEGGKEVSRPNGTAADDKNASWDIDTNIESVTVAVPNYGTVLDVRKLVMEELRKTVQVPEGARLSLHHVLNSRYIKPFPDDTLATQLPRPSHVARFTSGPSLYGELELPAPRQHDVSDSPTGVTEPSAPQANMAPTSEGATVTSLGAAPTDRACEGDSEASGPGATVDAAAPRLHVQTAPATTEEERFAVLMHYNTRGETSIPVAFGHPVLMRVYPGETLASLIYRVQQRLSVPDHEMAKWRFSRMHFHSKPCVMLDRLPPTPLPSPTGSGKSTYSETSSPVSYGPKPAEARHEAPREETNIPFYQQVLWDMPNVFLPGSREGAEESPVELGLRHVNKNPKNSLFLNLRDAQGGLTIRSS